jgi:uncharacterized membrane protein YkvA (DUF1232 family)
VLKLAHRSGRFQHFHRTTMNEPRDVDPTLPAHYSAPSWYSGPRLWKTLLKAAKAAGSKGLEAALVLFYCLKDRDTPAWARSVIIGALGYVVLPTDLLPDLLPGIGFTDDWGAVLAALGIVAAHIKETHRQLARTQLSRLLGQKSPAPPEEMFE